jgi:hypothetical protein
MTKKLLKISKYKPSLFQGTLDFVSGHRVSLAIEHPTERYLGYMLGALLVGLVACYLYFVSASILNVMARKEALARVAKIESVIGTTEQEYLALSSEIAPSEGSSLGLRPVEKTEYVRRPGTVGAATMAPNEI